MVHKKLAKDVFHTETKENIASITACQKYYMTWNARLLGMITAAG